MAKQEKMKFYDPPVRSMKKAVADIKGQKGEDIVEPIRERSRKMARREASRRTGRKR